MPWSKRHLIMPLARFINRLFFGIRLSDPQNGFRALSRQAAETIKIKSDGKAHCSEIIYQLFQEKFRVQEAPITVVPSLRPKIQRRPDYHQGFNRPKLNLSNMVTAIIALSSFFSSSAASSGRKPRKKSAATNFCSGSYSGWRRPRPSFSSSPWIGWLSPSAFPAAASISWSTSPSWLLIYFVSA